MSTHYITSIDGSKISYGIEGCGPALLLVHGGLGNYSKKIWYDNNWVDILKEKYTVIAPDNRGSGESDKSYEPGFYSVDNVLNDLGCILKHCHVDTFYYVGWSYGATIGFQMLKRNGNVKKAVCLGSILGDYFFRITVPGAIAELDHMNSHKKAGTLEKTNISLEDIEWAKSTDLDLVIAQYRSLSVWPGISAADISGEKLAICSGTDDTPLVLEQLKLQGDELLKNNITVKIFEDIDHLGLVRDYRTIIPWISDFFMEER